MSDAQMSADYPQFVVNLCAGLCEPLTSDDVRLAISRLTILFNTKSHQEKDTSQTKKKKKQKGTAAKQGVLSEEADDFVEGDYAEYEDYYGRE